MTTTNGSSKARIHFATYSSTVLGLEPPDVDFLLLPNLGDNLSLVYTSYVLLGTNQLRTDKATHGYQYRVRGVSNVIRVFVKCVNVCIVLFIV